MEYHSTYTGDVQVSVHMKTWHRCGQEQEMILQVKMDEAFSLDEHFRMPPLSLGYDPFTIPPRVYPTLTLKGNVEGLKSLGVDMSLMGDMFCTKCGENLYEPPPEG